MKCVFIYLLFLGLVLSSALPATEVDNEIEKRDYSFHDQIGQVASNSDVWGPTVLRASVIFNSIGVAAAVADAVSWCISNDAAGPDARSACIGAMKAAAQRATLVVAIVVGGTNLSGSSSKREDRVSAVEEALSQASIVTAVISSLSMWDRLSLRKILVRTMKKIILYKICLVTIHILGLSIVMETLVAMSLMIWIVI